MKKLILILILGLFLATSVSAVCTVTFDKESYVSTETISAEMSCSAPQERNIAYTLNWTNQSGYEIELDTGTTPGTTGQTFYETYTIPSDWTAGVWINATLPTGTLDGATDSANVTSTAAAANSLLITNASVGGKYLGLTTSIQAIVKDNTGKKISGGQCRFSAWSNDETQMLKSGTAQLFDGNLKFEWILDYLSFTEGTDFAVLLHCYCGSTGSSAECIDEDGGAITNSVGTAKVPFSTNSWLTINENPLPITYSNGTTYSDPVLYAGFDTVYFKRNLTNNHGTQLKAIKEVYIINNATGQVYDTSKSSQSPIATGNSSTIFDYKLPQDLETGIYYLKAFADIYYNDIQIVSKIMSTDTFNVTSIQDIMTINSITIKDYWGNTVNTSSGALNSSSMPTSNWTDPHTTLTEGFGYQICGNITNSYTSSIYWHMENLVIHNPTLGWSMEEFNEGSGERWQRTLENGDNNICWYNSLPLAIPTHSDYHFMFDVYIGDEKEAFDCEKNCGFSGMTNYFYTGAIEDSVVFDKWYTEPNATDDGVPLIFIVTEREEYLTMNDDCNYTDQEATDWGNASFMCTPKDGGSQIHLNLSAYPRAGEEFKVCFQTQNYLGTEIDLELYDIYIDSDQGETVIFWEDETDGYVPSIQEDKLWVSESPSRADELGGNLIDGYGIMCSKYLTLPPDTQGGNNWDIQGKVRINSDIYNLPEQIVWNWESDEFPIFGARQSEDFMRLVDITNITTNFLGSTATTGDPIIVNFTYDYFGYDDGQFIAEYCFEQTDKDDVEGCFEKLINPDHGSGNIISETLILPHSETSGQAEVTVTIYSLDGTTKLGFLDPEPSNTFNMTASDIVINNVALDKTNYYTGETMQICANVTNTYNRRLIFELEYDVRCSADINDDNTLDRNLLTQVVENRGVGGGQTQMQCAEVEIPYADHLKYKTTGCYATIALKSEFITSLTGHQTSTSSPVSNITDFGMYPQYEANPEYPLVRVFPDWRRFDDIVDSVDRSYYRAKINITNLNETWLDPTDTIGDADWDVYATFSNRMPCSNSIYNYTVLNASGVPVNNPTENKALVWSDGILENRCAIGIENVNFSDADDDYFEVRVWFEDFQERQTEALEGSQTALEGIENKTGTFHLDAACPSSGTIGGDMSCILTAYVEDSQTVQKEVDFTCHISDGTSTYSSINFNQMITKTPVALTQTFTVPSTFTHEQEYTLQCYADYYNLGSRRDSFHDTFIASTGGGGSGTSTGSGGEYTEIEEEYAAPITGKVTLAGEDLEGQIWNPLTPKGKRTYTLFAIILLLIAALIFVTSKIKSKCKDRIHLVRPRHYKLNLLKKIAGISIFLLVLLFSILGIYALGANLINAFQQIPTGTIIKDPLFRTIILSTFIITAIIILFKTLHIKAEITIGHRNPIEKYWKNHHRHN
jgi:hypothetical protein